VRSGEGKGRGGGVGGESLYFGRENTDGKHNFTITSFVSVLLYPLKVLQREAAPAPACCLRLRVVLHREGAADHSLLVVDGAAAEEGEGVDVSHDGGRGAGGRDDHVKLCEGVWVCECVGVRREGWVRDRVRVCGSGCMGVGPGAWVWVRVCWWGAGTLQTC